MRPDLTLASISFLITCYDPIMPTYACWEHRTAILVKYNNVHIFCPSTVFISCLRYHNVIWNCLLLSVEKLCMFLPCCFVYTPSPVNPWLRNKLFIYMYLSYVLTKLRTTIELYMYRKVATPLPTYPYFWTMETILLLQTIPHATILWTRCFLFLVHTINLFCAIVCESWQHKLLILKSFVPCVPM